MVKCRDAIEGLGNFVDGVLPVTERLRLTLHLRQCKHCRNYLQSYRITLRAAQAMRDDMRADVPDSLVERIVRASNKKGDELLAEPAFAPENWPHPAPGIRDAIL
jgi:anti-sigma factor RsiW